MFKVDWGFREDQVVNWCSSSEIMFILSVGIQLMLSVRIRGKRVLILVGGLLWRCTRVLVRRPVMRWRGLISEFKVGNNLFSASHYIYTRLSFSFRESDCCSLSFCSSEGRRLII